MSAQCLLNGKPVSADHFADRACQYGDGVFETLAIVQGHACQMSRHMKRLQRGCDRLAIPRPDFRQLDCEAEQLISNCKTGVLRIVISAGASGRGYARCGSQCTRFLQLSEWPDTPMYGEDAGLRVMQCQTRLGLQPQLAGIKHLNRLEQVLARNELLADYDEGLMWDVNDHPISGVMSSLYLFQAGRWLLPALDQSGVAGIVREVFLDEAVKYQATVDVRPLTTSDLYAAESVFLSNSLLGMRQVLSLDQATYAPQSLPIVEAVNQRCLSGSEY